MIARRKTSLPKPTETIPITTPKDWNDIVIQPLLDRGACYVKLGSRRYISSWIGSTPKYIVSKYTVKSGDSPDKLRLICLVKDGQKVTRYIYKENLSGLDAQKLIDATIKLRTGKSMKSAFGTIEKDLKVQFDTYANKNIGYAQPGHYLHMNKADISSAYPAAMCGSLPDAHGYKLVNGYAEPNEEYPFAFYMKSGHMSIYQEFNTFDFNKFVLEHTKGEDRLGPEKIMRCSFKPLDIFNEQTLLMKKSKYELTNEMKTLYNNKYIGSEQHRKDAKLMSIAFVGQLRSLKYNRFCYQPHLSSVVYCRHLKKMSDLIDEIENVGGKIRHVITDCIAWEGPRIPSMTKDKYLGAFHEELYRARYEIRHQNCYSYYLNGTLVKKGERKENMIKVSEDTDWFIDERWINGECVYRRKKNEEIF